MEVERANKDGEEAAEGKEGEYAKVGSCDTDEDIPRIVGSTFGPYTEHEERVDEKGNAKLSESLGDGQRVAGAEDEVRLEKVEAVKAALMVSGLEI
jgi:hypothetical protein